MGLEEFILPLIIGVIALVLALWILSLRRIVELKYADVVVRKSGSTIYSADATIEGSKGAIYYDIPSWIPIWGCIVKRMPLEIIQIAIKDYDTFAKANARFIITVSVYCRIKNVNIAAQRFPGNNINDFKAGMSAIIVSAIRKTTANYAIEDIISKRKEIGDDIRDEILQDFERWGVELTNVAVETIADAEGATVIHDISAKKESEINSLSRQQIALMNKSAAIAEAENRQLSETRKIEADEQIAIREQTKAMTVATKQQEAVTKQLEVERTQKEVSANIDANASIKTAEGVKQSAIIKAEGEKQALELIGAGEGAKNKSIGLADADVIKAKKVAEAEGLSAYADAQKKQQEYAKEIRLIEKDQVVGLALAEALKAANIKYIGSGQPKDFMDLFSVAGGMSTGGSIGTMLDMIRETDPELHKSVINAIENVSKKDKGFSLDNIDEKTVEMVIGLIKATKPEVYKQIKELTKDEEKSSSE
ncbi:MAG: SPFH domain-containing protein [Tissierellia bacterium]|nr:SPFH domain-containing protein [Tissierellia bacterium]